MCDFSIIIKLQDFEQLFHSYCKITNGTYKGMGSLEGCGMGGGDRVVREG